MDNDHNTIALKMRRLMGDLLTLRPQIRRLREVQGLKPDDPLERLYGGKAAEYMRLKRLLRFVGAAV